MSKQESKTPAHQSFTLVKCVTPHDRLKEKYVFIVTDKIASSYKVNGMAVSTIINNTPSELQVMPISVGVCATEDAILEYVAVPKDGFKEVWSLMKEWSKSTDVQSFMASFWRAIFIEAGNQLTHFMAVQRAKVAVGIPMEMLTEELMRELFSDDEIQ